MVLAIVVSLIFVIAVQQFKLRENLQTKLFFIQKIFFFFNENLHLQYELLILKVF